MENLKSILNKHLTKYPMSRDTYFREMRKRGKIAYSYIVKYIENEYPSNSIRNSIMHFIYRRSSSSSLLLKPFLVFLSYESCGGDNWRSIIPAAAACELINISSYQSNAVYDHKYGILNKREKDNQIVASFLTRELAQKMISLSEIDCQPKILELISDINKNINIGQFLELNTLHLQNLDLNLPLVDYLKLYLKKCYTISGVFTINCTVIGYLLSGKLNLEILQTLKNFGMSYGIALNIINDISDYIPSDEGLAPCYKSVGDQLSDIKNGRIFLPVYYAISNGTNTERDFILNLINNPEKIDLNAPKKLLNVLINTQALGFSYSIAKLFMKISKQNLKILPPSFARSLLSIMASGIRTNKFLFNLRRHGLRAVKLDNDIIDYINKYWKNNR